MGMIVPNLVYGKLNILYVRYSLDLSTYKCQVDQYCRLISYLGPNNLPDEKAKITTNRLLHCTNSTLLMQVTRPRIELDPNVVVITKHSCRKWNNLRKETWKYG